LCAWVIYTEVRFFLWAAIRSARRCA